MYRITHDYGVCTLKRKTINLLATIARGEIAVPATTSRTRDDANITCNNRRVRARKPLDRAKNAFSIIAGTRFSASLSPLRDVHDRDTRVTASAYDVRSGVKSRCVDLSYYYYY